MPICFQVSKVGEGIISFGQQYYVTTISKILMDSDMY